MAEKKYRLVDYYFEGGYDINGVMKTVKEKDAVENAIKMWIVSIEGDIVRLGGYGGYIYKLLHKPMSDSVVNSLQLMLEIGFSENFTPVAIIESLSIVPNYQQKTYELDMEVFIPEYNYNIEFSGALINRS